MEVSEKIELCKKLTQARVTTAVADNIEPATCFVCWKGRLDAEKNGGASDAFPSIPAPISEGCHVCTNVSVVAASAAYTYA